MDFLNRKLVKRMGIYGLIFLISGIVAAIGWTKLSYESYYNGVAASKNIEVKLCSNAVESILHLDVPEHEKMKHLEALFRELKAEVKILNLSSGKVLYEKENPRRGYIKEIDYNHSFVVDAVEYNFSYSFFNRPPWAVGLARAVTCSLYDYFTEDVDFSTWRKNFVKYRSWERSANFYLILVVVCSLLVALYKGWINRMRTKTMQYKLKEEETRAELAEKEIDLIKMQMIAQEKQALLEEERAKEIEAELKHKLQEEATRAEMAEKEADLRKMQIIAQEKEALLEEEKLQYQIAENENCKIRGELESLEKFKLMYSRMMEDVNKEIYDASKQELTKLSIGWKEITERVMHSERHDLRNKLTNNELDEYEEKVYARVVRPSVETILEHWKNALEKMSIDLEEVDVDRVVLMLEDLKERSFAKKSWLTTVMKVDLPEDHEGSCVKINLKRLESIMINLWDNSSRILELKDVQNMASSMYEEECEYIIETAISVVEIDEKKYLKICVTDNGGGFEPDVLPSIYQKAIKSSKGERMGEGTMYIAFFVQLMNGKIQARNFVWGDSVVGAQSEMQIPIWSSVK